MEPLPATPFQWFWAWAGVGFTLVVASCTLMPLMYLDAVAEELIRQDREGQDAVASMAEAKVVPFTSPRRVASWLGRRVL